MGHFRRYIYWNVDSVSESLLHPGKRLHHQGHRALDA